MVQPSIQNTAKRTYKDAIAALNSLQSNFAQIQAVRDSGQKRNPMTILEMYEWTRRIGYQAADFDKLNIVHITGTKGKGSTAAFTQSILRQYGLNVGLYTSPHLRSVRERISINGEPIAEEKFTRYFFEVWDRLSETVSDESQFPHMTKGMMPGYFKYLTLLSFHVFMNEGVNSAVYEVGVGGEFDSTNIIQHPTACGVSLLGIDHTFMLGDTLHEIAWNKGGIFKHGAKAFTVEQPQEGLDELKARATERETSLEIVPESSLPQGLELGIAGDFQRTNAALAVQLARAHLEKLGYNLGDIDNASALPSKFVTGLRDTHWDGRCQTISEGNIKWFIDGAHTKESVMAASGWFKKVASPEKKRILLFNQQSRDANALVQYLHDVVAPLGFDEVYFTTNVTWSSGGYSDDLVSLNTDKAAVDALEVQKNLADKWAQLQPESKRHVCSSIQESIEKIRSIGGEVEVFVTGSLHLVGGVLVVMDK